jgi:hypothetical protein
LAGDVIVRAFTPVDVEVREQAETPAEFEAVQLLIAFPVPPVTEIVGVIPGNPRPAAFLRVTVMVATAVPSAVVGPVAAIVVLLVLGK